MISILISIHDGDAYRAVYYLKHEDVVFILHCFKKKSTSGGAIPPADRKTIDARLATAKVLITQMRKGEEK